MAKTVEMVIYKSYTISKPGISKINKLRGYFFVITVYLCFLAGGLVVPLISFIMGALTNGMESDLNADMDLDTDFDLGTDLGDGGFDGELDTGDISDVAISGDVLDGGIGSMISIGLIPTSLLALSALAITFGAVGSIMTITDKNKIFTLVLAIITGYLASVVVQTLIKSLKKIQTRNYGVNENELMLYDGKVVDTILPGQVGSVSFMTLKNVLVTYPAKCKDSQIKLPAGKIVTVLEKKDGIFIVEPKNKYDE